MQTIFAYPGQEQQAGAVAKHAGAALGAWNIHRFPDGETLAQITAGIAGQDVWLYCSLQDPNPKLADLMFFARAARDLGARSVGLVAPYLAYMRQDTRFEAGQAITADIFADFLSHHFDRLITVDPHLHRHKKMEEFYAIPARVLHAAGPVANWVRANVMGPVFVGPDEESAQWVGDVAAQAGADYTVLTKTRRGDADVEISVPNVQHFTGHTPVLVDDIISTARTMIETVKQLQNAGLAAPVCVGVHGVFAGQAYTALKASGAAQIVTCNSIVHESNDIDLTPMIGAHLAERFA